MNSLPKTVTRQRRDFDLNPGPSVPESSMLTTTDNKRPHRRCHLANNIKNIDRTSLYSTMDREMSARTAPSPGSSAPPPATDPCARASLYPMAP